MYTKFIPKNIQEKLKARERALAYKESNANEPVKVGDVKTIRPKDIQSRTTFVRMCSNKVEGTKNIVISGGKRNPDDGTMKFGFMKRRVRDGAREEAGDVYENRKSGIRPSAGIKSIEVGYKGSWKAIREATINWVVGSIEELDDKVSEIFSNIKPKNETKYIYESPDGGQTLYRREFGKAGREKVNE